MKVTPYLSFDGRCEEALEFYKKALGAQTGMVVRFSESPEPMMVPPEGKNKIMHARFRIGETEFMASDGQCQGKTKFEGISLSITASNQAEAERYFGALAEGGKVQMPLTKTFFSPCFGMLADRFGITWMIIVENRQAS